MKIIEPKYWSGFVDLIHSMNNNQIPILAKGIGIFGIYWNKISKSIQINHQNVEYIIESINNNSINEYLIIINLRKWKFNEIKEYFIKMGKQQNSFFIITDVYRI